MRSRSEHYSTDLMDRLGDTWRQQAACRDYDPEWWFALPGTAQRAQALNICQTQCPVVDTCRQAALDHGEEGIWGGTTEDERRALLQQPRRRSRTGPRSQHYDRVLELAAQGYYDREIADATGLAVNSIKKMRERHSIASGRTRRRELHREVMGR